MGTDVYPDVATIDVERRQKQQHHVQRLGMYMYGQDYIYEPVYYSTLH
jgi:hypothetical protein